MGWITGNSYTTTSPVNTALINGIGSDLRTWGGPVDAGGNNLANVAQLTTTGKVGIGFASPASRLYVNDTNIAPTLVHQAAATAVFSSGASGSPVELAIAINYPDAALQTRAYAVDGYSYALALNPLGGGVIIGDRKSVV